MSNNLYNQFPTNNIYQQFPNNFLHNSNMNHSFYSQNWKCTNQNYHHPHYVHPVPYCPDCYQSQLDYFNFISQNPPQITHKTKTKKKSKPFWEEDFYSSPIKSKPKKKQRRKKDKDYSVNTTFYVSTGDDPFLSFMSNIMGMNEGDEEQEKKVSNEPKTEEVVEVEEDMSKYDFKYLGSVSNLVELIELGHEYQKLGKKYRSNLNMNKLIKIVPALEELNQLVGMEKIKTAIFNKLVFYLQELESNKDMLHLAIQGSPGVGKSTVIGILAKIYKSLGILSKGHIVSVKRDELVAGYVGQTSIKTRKLLDKAKGGILVIDEAHSFGCEDHKDSFAKEAMDLITAYASEEANDMVIIIAGYEEQLDKCFFNYNEGLARRFTRYTIDGYTPEQLRQIFFKIVKESDWTLEDETQIPETFFQENKKYFIFNGGDMSRLFTMAKNCHSKRLLSLKTEKDISDVKKKLNYPDIKEGLKLLLLSPEFSKRDDFLKYNQLYT